MTPSSGSVSLAERIVRLVESSEFELPALPDLVARLQQELAREDPDARKVADWIRTEPAVAASLLRTANSAVYGGLRPISDLSQAMARLGLSRVRSLVTTLMVQGQFKTRDPRHQALLRVLWDHAIVSAVGARMLAERENHDREEAFMAGLLHGIGRLMVLKAVDQLPAGDLESSVTLTLEDELVETMQFDLGQRTLRSWNLSENICNAARATDPSNSSETTLLNTIVQIADLLAMKLGAHPKPDPALCLVDQEPVDRLQIRAVELAALLVDLEDAIATIREAL